MVIEMSDNVETDTARERSSHVTVTSSDIVKFRNRTYRTSPSYLTSGFRMDDFWIIPSLLFPLNIGSLFKKNQRMISSLAAFVSS